MILLYKQWIAAIHWKHWRDYQYDIEAKLSWAIKLNSKPIFLICFQCHLEITCITCTYTFYSPWNVKSWIGNNYLDKPSLIRAWACFKIKRPHPPPPNKKKGIINKYIPRKIRLESLQIEEKIVMHLFLQIFKGKKLLVIICILSEIITGTCFNYKITKYSIYSMVGTIIIFITQIHISMV